MGNNEYGKEIKKLRVSPEFKELKKYYNRETIFDILGTTTNENIHSNFFSWIFDLSSSHKLGDEPLKKLLKLLIKNGENKIENKQLKECLKTDNYKILWMNIKREEKTYESRGHIDLFIDFKLQFENKKYNMVIILENKIDSGINVSRDRIKKNIDDLKGEKLVLNNTYISQLKKYKDYAIKIKEFDINCEVILTFLSPEYNIPDDMEPDYINITYQDVVSDVLEKCLAMINKDNDKAKNIIEDYICNVSKTRMYKNVIAISNYEKELILNIYKNNKKALEIIFENLEILFNKPDSIDIEQKKVCEFYSENIKILKPIFKILNKYEDNKFNISSFKNKNNCYRIDGGELLNIPNLIKKIVDKIDDFGVDEEDKKEKIINYTGKMLPLYIDMERSKKIEKNTEWYGDYGENRILIAYYSYEIDRIIDFLNSLDNEKFKIERYK